MGCGFCEAALSNTVGTLVVDCVVKPVGRQLDYVRCFHDNVEKLREKKRELADARVRLLHKIEDAKNRLLLIENDVQNLQSRADETLSDMGTLEEEIQLNKRCLNRCPNWSWRYQLSKKAMKKIQDISELLDKFGQLGPVGYPAPSALPTIDFLCSKEFVFSKSSETAFYQIIEALKDENINMIGLWGMGGVGKTTLAREVGSQAQKLKLFDKVVITVASQKPNFEKIEDEIAQYIGFDMKNEQGRRSEQELWLRLKNEPRILIILDDIWESINLKEKIGIPIGDDHKGCKVLLTTRRQQVCQAMDCQNLVQLGCLNDDEARTLFEKKAGLDDFSDDSIKIRANQIGKKCGGLPIAIVPLGSALKGKTHYEWQAAYRRLKDRRLTEIEDVNEENAYVCLEASFDYLKNMETKTYACKQLLEDVESLELGYVEGHPNLIPSLDLGFRKLTSLDLRGKLSLSRMFHLEEMCNAPQPQGFLQKLEEVIVSGCSEMQVLFPIAELRSIEQEGPSRYLSLQSLKIVKIWRSNNLKYIFPMSVANSLGQLHTLKIESCSQLEDIIQDRQVAYKCLLQSLREVLYFSKMIEKKQISNVTVPERRGGTSISNFEELFEYPRYNLSSLEKLTLSKLTKLRVIWSGPIQVEHFQNLTRLQVRNCRRLRYIFSPTIARNLPQLSWLHIADCEELEQIIEKDQTPSQHHLQPICFPNFWWITIINCENLKCLFPIPLVHGGLPKLSGLCLRQVSKLEQVFEGDETNLNEEEEKVIRLPLLRFLKLVELPNLVSFSPVGYQFVFPFLTYLQVKGCPNMTTRFSVGSEKSVHAKTQMMKL
ncbi:hypothetical protein ES319_D05G378600v1 [Gossypium barbadense]|uniref:Uncharacterized protein n=1 Tax=Gossypium barbadense TaxID=3634 RepID=A0A5J5RRU7_GOSBA|nr:hypothetical protein ES319_D05G378600v1 [Gossypium barbadense]